MIANATRVCIIGAGIGGLSAARYLKAENINFTLIESSKYVGGTWHYDERVGKDENGIPIHTSMYKNLRTNLPKVTMELPGFPMPEDIPTFPSWEVIYNYLKSYAEHFDLYKLIKFEHQAISVKKFENEWKVKYKHTPTGKEVEEKFDYVVVATGHHSKPYVPNFPGESLFKGNVIHSHDYRVPDPYKCKKVLIIGSGPSGMDISLEVELVAKRVIHSHHSKEDFNTPFPKHHIMKPDIKEFNETGVIFTDGTYEEIDDVIICTGYKYDYPFLDKNCGLNITRYSVTPVYRHLVNINQPTMMVMGLFFHACLPKALDAQARYATALIKGDFTLPSQDVMMREWQKKYDEIRSAGRPITHIHELGDEEDEYYAALSEESGIEKVPTVMFKIRLLDMEAMTDNLYTFRNFAYTVKDNDTFVRSVEVEEAPRIFPCAGDS
ncbi:hypothetical protein ABMA27_007471 [Loxostege sticticalis]|uniref:Flavin-containing monooxygenase n=1 Tax=Loxostege sticticalis TaxID=481309 RepID=A0ABR3HFJ9_LOXSC